MILERIKQYIDYKSINTSKFEKEIGMSNNSFRKSLLNNGNIGSDKLENILNRFPEISAEWLLTGKGEMLKTQGDGVQNEKYTEVLEKYANLQEKHLQLHEKYAQLLEECKKKDAPRRVGVAKTGGR